MAEHKEKRFRLAFVNAAEDVPRIVRAYGRACFGEFALVLRPADRRGVLVRMNKDGAWMWRSTEESDAPVLPDVAVDAKDAVTLVKTEQKAVPKPGPITLRSQWTGYLHCEGGVPRVELSRKLAAYGILRITSSADGWTWTVERTEKWFSTPGSDAGTAPTLVGAIEAGLARAMGLLGEACSTRDSRRRAALDENYAAAHPSPPGEGRQGPYRAPAPEGAAEEGSTGAPSDGRAGRAAGRAVDAGRRATNGRRGRPGGRRARRNPGRELGVARLHRSRGRGRLVPRCGARGHRR